MNTSVVYGVEKIKAKVQKRLAINKVLWPILFIVMVSSWLYPPIGFLLLICMASPVIISLKSGRAWCSVCPRGAFFDTIMPKLSRDRGIPAILRTNLLRGIVLSALIMIVSIGFYNGWGDIRQMGAVLSRMLTITTVIGIILGMVFSPRSWCALCPMGSLAGWVGGIKKPLTIDEKCVNCKRCDKKCPMKLSPSSYSLFGAINSSDCIKCGLCAASCLKNAIQQ